MTRLLRILAAMAAGVSLETFAEMRVWTDSRGKTVEAEHVRSSGGDVYLRLKDGDEIKVSLDSLSAADRRYLSLLAPVRIEIEVSPKTERANKGYGGGFQIQEESVIADVRIRKSSSAPYDAPLVADLFIIGRMEMPNGYKVLDRQKTRFVFSADNRNEHRFSSDRVDLVQFEGGVKKGLKYDGYLVVVKDVKGTVIDFRSSRLDFQKNAEAIMTAERGALFDKDFNPLDREMLKRDGADGKRPPVTRRLPGRRF